MQKQFSRSQSVAQDPDANKKGMVGFLDLFLLFKIIGGPAGYRRTPKIFLYTGKILQVVSLF